jgi:hypothetical protein
MKEPIAMVAKRIDLGNGLVFSSISAGKAHFDRILKNTPLEQHVTPQEFSEVRALYELYCRNTNWPLHSPPKAFFPTYKKGPGYTTTCFGVEFLDGKKDHFSLDRALSAVAV